MGTQVGRNLLRHAGQVDAGLDAGREADQHLAAGRQAARAAPSGAGAPRPTSRGACRSASGSTARCSTSAQPAPGTATTRLGRPAARCRRPSRRTRWPGCRRRRGRSGCGRRAARCRAREARPSRRRRWRPARRSRRPGTRSRPARAPSAMVAPVGPDDAGQVRAGGRDGGGRQRRHDTPERERPSHASQRTRAHGLRLRFRAWATGGGTSSTRRTATCGPARMTPVRTALDVDGIEAGTRQARCAEPRPDRRSRLR